MHITLYRKYRPSSFSEISGENEIVKSLKLSLKNNLISHAYLFSGPRGTGKTTTARLIAKGVNCLDLMENGEPCNKCKNCISINEGRFSDLIEIDAASNRSIDEIRALKEKINYQPVEGLKKVYIIDEAHMLTKEAFNALLKTLEEPPSHVIFILATTELEKILPTIVSRCQRYDFKSLDLEEMKSRLKFILSEEGIEMTEEVFPLIHENSSGSMRDSISILERLIISTNEKKIDMKIAEEALGITPSERIKKFLEKLLAANEYDIINELENLSTESFDLELFFKDLAKYIKNSMIKSEIDISLGLKIISIIYDVIGKFKFEDNKKLVGYVIVSDILSTMENKARFSSSEIKYEPERKLEKKEIEKNEIKEKKSDKKISISINEIKNSWTNLVNEASKLRISYKVFLMYAEPSSLSENTLTVFYDEQYKYAKEQMESGEYGEEFLNIAKDFFKEENLVIKYELTGKKLTQREENSEFHKKIKDFFEGNIS
ncbi:DNA polymerase III subunit gamma/tau [Fusobacterium russii]|uniref:DNA polymerase III subunit gamma/tau n=1 Tax=Fusobacterium russii TaxID=854 RepID=UPI00039B86D1|nr:DNA polymerase III subunit gamma/tau [Fusobacterium russii]